MRTSSQEKSHNQKPNPYHPGKESLTISYFREGQFREVSLETVAHLTVRDLCNKPFIFRFDTPGGRVYFVGAEEPLLKLRSEGKNVRWLHDLIEYWRQDLILRGFPKETSIYHWRLQDISILQNALIVFPGSEVEAGQ